MSKERPLVMTYETKDFGKPAEEEQENAGTQKMGYKPLTRGIDSQYERNRNEFKKQQQKLRSEKAKSEKSQNKRRTNFPKKQTQQSKTKTKSPAYLKNVKLHNS